MNKIGTRAKSKNNPKGLCKVCGDKIFNRVRSALVCIKCSKIINWLWPKLGSLKHSFRKIFPGYKLTIRYKLEKKK